MDFERLKAQLYFIAEADKVKSIFRRTILLDRSRRENDAEHSWHLALMAVIFREYASNQDISLERVIKMVTVHDIIEIYAGDTFAFDEKANEDKEERESRSADKLFGLLPEDQGKELRSLWEEFDAMETPDAVFASCLDRFQPFFHNYLTMGHTWQLGQVTKEQVLKRMNIIRTGMSELWPFVETVIDDGIQKGWIKE